MCVDTDCTCCNNANYIRVKVESQGRFKILYKPYIMAFENNKL